jgi:large subunit ribosomal protein L2
MLSLKKNLLINRVRRFLIIGFSKRAGKNCFGRKTIFTQSGGYKLFYNNIDYKRNLSDIFILLRIEKNILYTSFLGFVCYSNGYFCYILLSDYIKNIKTIYSGFVTYYNKYGPSFLSLIPAGNFIHHVEVIPTKGVKLMRAAGTMCFIISKENNYSFLKMKSG